LRTWLFLILNGLSLEHFIPEDVNDTDDTDDRKGNWRLSGPLTGVAAAFNG
jgi:hypothetical protein